MPSELGIALLGVGTVGRAVAGELVRHPERLAARSGGPLRLRCIAERDSARLDDLDVSGARVVADPAEALGERGVDLVVELLGGIEPAGGLLLEALRRGAGAVTANKAVIAHHGHRLAAEVRLGSGGLAFEAAVGAAIPVLAMLRDSLGGDQVRSITAVINGTTNHVLERMGSGDSLDAALLDAQMRGYAEADPSADVEGHDAAQKLCILAWFAMGAEVSPEQVERRGIRDISEADVAAAAALGCAIRLVARAERSGDGIALSVQPTLLPRGHPLAGLRGPENAVIVESDLAGSLLLAGHGAGSRAAASAVLSDVAAVARARREGRTVPLPAASPVRVLDREEAETPAWLRLRVRGDPDAPAILAQVLEDRGVSVESLAGSANGELNVLARATPRAVLGRALETLDTLPVLDSAVQVLDRLETLG
jgi:homoserine dehydrogenase